VITSVENVNVYPVRVKTMDTNNSPIKSILLDMYNLHVLSLFSLQGQAYF